MNRHRKMLTGCVVKPHFVLLHAQVLRIKKGQVPSIQLRIIGTVVIYSWVPGISGCYWKCYVGQGSVDGIAARYWLDSLVIESWWG